MNGLVILPYIALLLINFEVSHVSKIIAYV